MLQDRLPAGMLFSHSPCRDAAGPIARGVPGGGDAVGPTWLAAHGIACSIRSDPVALRLICLLCQTVSCRITALFFICRDCFFNPAVLLSSYILWKPWDPQQLEGYI